MQGTSNFQLKKKRQGIFYGFKFATIGERLIIIGGYNPFTSLTIEDVHLFHTGTKEFEQLESLKESRGWHSVVQISETCLIIIGGRKDIRGNKLQKKRNFKSKKL